MVMRGQLALERLGLSGLLTPHCCNARLDILHLGFRVPISPGRKEDRQQCPLSAQAGTRLGDIIRAQVLAMSGQEHSLCPLPGNICHFKGVNFDLYFFFLKLS